MVRRKVDRPLLLENPTYYALMPGAQMTEAQFLTEVVTRADCGLLLDINKVYANARNHGSDASAFLGNLPLERVRQVHLAGHSDRGDVIIDTHVGPIIPPLVVVAPHVPS